MDNYKLEVIRVATTTNEDLQKGTPFNIKNYNKYLNFIPRFKNIYFMDSKEIIEQLYYENKFKKVLVEFEVKTYNC